VGSLTTWRNAEWAAEYIGKSLRTLHGLAAAGEIPHRQPPGSRGLLFDPDEIDAWINGAPLEVLHVDRNGKRGRVVRVIAAEKWARR
jgi:excisionase family DNA binding protein